MPKAPTTVKEPTYIERRPGVRGGAPVIVGAGIRVLDVAVRYEVMGMPPEEITLAFPHLSLPQVHAALAYYYAHKAELDKEWKESLRKIARLRRSQPSVLERKLGQVEDLYR